MFALNIYTIYVVRADASKAAAACRKIADSISRRLVSTTQKTERRTMTQTHTNTDAHTRARWVIVCQNADEWCSHDIVELTMVYSCTAPGNELL